MKKRYFALCFFVLYSVSMTIYLSYCVNVRGLEVEFTEQIQKEYASYLIKTNDKMIDLMFEYSAISKNPQRVLTPDEKEALTKNIQDKNKLLIKLQTNPPDNSNTDYSTLYKDILKLYAFYIQGDVLKSEYLFSYKNSYTKEEIEGNLDASEETLAMGIQITNIMGDSILDIPIIVNEIRNTDYKSKHNISDETLEETLPEGIAPATKSDFSSIQGWGETMEQDDN